MPKTNVVSIRINDSLKNNVEKILAQLGLNTSDAINMYFRQIELIGGIPFDVVLPKYNEETLKAMEETENIVKDNSIVRYRNIDSLKTALEIE